MKTYTPEQFKQKYGEVGIAQFSQKPQEKTKEPSYFSRVGSQIKSQFNEAVQSEQASMSGERNPISAGLNIAKNVTGIIAAPIAQAPGIRQLGEAFGKTGEAIVDTKLGNKATDLLSRVPEPVLSGTSDILETAMNLATLEGTTRSAKGLYDSGKNMVNKLNTPKTPPPPEPPTTPNQTSAGIMDRVARLKPTDATRFKDMTGKTHGQYLADTGNFGTPDKIIQSEAVKFTNSLKEVDSGLAQLPGKYQSAPILEALKGLVEKTKTQSSGSIKAPFYNDVANLVAKYKSGGLTHLEINTLKRLYEKNVKLGYNKLINADAVAKSTNIDSALRKWQVNQARTQGFKNIDELNKQTQASKFIINKLGDQVVGQNGLNSIRLTDWIMLSGGDPAAVVGFLTKKFFSSKAVQAKIAEIMRTAESTSPVKANIGQSEIKQLPAPKEGSLQSQNFTPPKLPTRSLPDEKGVSRPQSLKVKVSSPENSLISELTDLYNKAVKNTKK